MYWREPTITSVRNPVGVQLNGNTLELYVNGQWRNYHWVRMEGRDNSRTATYEGILEISKPQAKTLLNALQNPTIDPEVVDKIAKSSSPYEVYHGENSGRFFDLYTNGAGLKILKPNGEIIVYVWGEGDCDLESTDLFDTQIGINRQMRYELVEKINSFLTKE